LHSGSATVKTSRGEIAWLLGVDAELARLADGSARNGVVWASIDGSKTNRWLSALWVLSGVDLHLWVLSDAHLDAIAAAAQLAWVKLHLQSDTGQLTNNGIRLWVGIDSHSTIGCATLATTTVGANTGIVDTVDTDIGLVGSGCDGVVAPADINFWVDATCWH